MSFLKKKTTKSDPKPTPVERPAKAQGPAADPQAEPHTEARMAADDATPTAEVIIPPAPVTASTDGAIPCPVCGTLRVGLAPSAPCPVDGWRLEDAP